MKAYDLNNNILDFVFDFNLLQLRNIKVNSTLIQKTLLFQAKTFPNIGMLECAVESNKLYWTIQRPIKMGAVSVGEI